MTRTAIIAGHGPGFCEQFAETLAREGYAIGMFARSDEYLDTFEATLREAGHEALAVPTDVTDPDQVADGVARVRERFGPIEVLAHTASFHADAAAKLDPARFEQSWRVYTYSPLLCFREALEDLRDRGGTALFFGAAPEIGDVDYKSAKDGTRGLARALAREYGPEGIHVAHVVINGSMLNPDKYDRFDEIVEAEHMDPAAVAETCYHLVEQGDRARTFELDLQAIGRPMVE